MDADIRLCEPSITEAEIDAVERVLRSGWLAHGDANDAFEAGLAATLDVRHVVTVNSCASALQLALEAHGVTGEVLVPSFTFAASANSIVRAGAEPVFVDIEVDTYCLDPADAADAVTARTEAIMPVHYAGHPCDMDAVMALADAHDLVVIEDAAETLGGRWNGQPAGTFGTGCFSFYPTKAITTAEGGAVATDDANVAEAVRTLAGHGIPDLDSPESWYRPADYAGYNMRMSNVHAAIGTAQLDRLSELNDRRREHARYLNLALVSLDHLHPPTECPEAHHVYQMYPVMTDRTIDRDALVVALRARGIGASVHFDPPVHRQPRYGTDRNLLTTDLVATNIFTLPLYPGLTEAQLDTIAEAVIEEVQHARSATHD